MRLRCVMCLHALQSQKIVIYIGLYIFAPSLSFLKFNMIADFTVILIVRYMLVCVHELFGQPLYYMYIHVLLKITETVAFKHSIKKLKNAFLPVFLVV